MKWLYIGFFIVLLALVATAQGGVSVDADLTGVDWGWLPVAGYGLVGLLALFVIVKIISRFGWGALVILLILGGVIAYFVTIGDTNSAALVDPTGNTAIDITYSQINQANAAANAENTGTNIINGLLVIFALGLVAFIAILAWKNK